MSLYLGYFICIKQTVMASDLVSKAKKVAMGPRTKSVTFKPKGKKEVVFTRHTKGIGALKNRHLRARAIASSALGVSPNKPAVAAAAKVLMASSDKKIQAMLKV